MLEFAGFNTTPRSCSPTSVPPGSRRHTTSRPIAERALAKKRIWVVLPAPSPPSNVTNTPRSGACSAESP